MAMRIVTVLYDYKATNVDELDLIQNEKLVVFDRDSSGWWLGRKCETLTSGLVPGIFYFFYSYF